MAIWLQHKAQRDIVWEILSYDKDLHRVVARGHGQVARWGDMRDGIVTDPNFHIDAVRKDYDLLTAKPDMKGLRDGP